MDRLIRTAPTGGGGVVAAPSARLWFRPGVHFVCLGADAVLLDVPGDGYHCLPDGAALCRRLAEGGPAPIDDVVRALVSAGLAGPEPRPAPTVPPPLPTRSAIHERRPFDLLRDPPAALTAVAHVRAARRGAALSRYLSWADRPPRSDPPATLEAAQRFWSLMPYLPIDGECLVRSALLMRFLAALGLKAEWVFGVRLCPFMAHCWVQVDGVCLNDDVERLAAYTPIMVR